MDRKRGIENKQTDSKKGSDGETGRQTDRKKNLQTDRQTDIWTLTESEITETAREEN